MSNNATILLGKCHVIIHKMENPLKGKKEETLSGIISSLFGKYMLIQQKIPPGKKYDIYQINKYI